MRFWSVVQDRRESQRSWEYVEGETASAEPVINGISALDRLGFAPKPGPEMLVPRLCGPLALVSSPSL
jgi:hypothetical protein